MGEEKSFGKLWQICLKKEWSEYEMLWNSGQEFGFL